VPLSDDRSLHDIVLEIQERNRRLARVAAEHALAHPQLRRRLVIGAAASLIVVQLALLAPGYVLAAQIVDGALVLVFLNASWILDSGRPAILDPSAAALRALGLVAVIPLVAAGMPLGRLSQATGTLLVAASVAAAALLLAPSTGIALRNLVTGNRFDVQIITAVAGLGLGLVAYFADDRSSGGPAATTFVAIVGAATVEEIAFRGILQQTLDRVLGPPGVVVAAAIFASTYVGTGSAALAFTLALAGVVFALSLASTGSLGGPLAGHIMLVVGAVMVWPEVFGHVPHRQLLHAVMIVVLTAGIAAGVVVLLRRPRPDDD
jgi:membrane protease YdiL (CAAX protease family)